MFWLVVKHCRSTDFQDDHALLQDWLLLTLAFFMRRHTAVAAKLSKPATPSTSSSSLRLPVLTPRSNGRIELHTDVFRLPFLILNLGSISISVASWNFVATKINF